MGSKVFAVIDTNVIVSALISKNPESSPLLVLAHVYSGTITPVFNADILQEYREVLSRKKFHLHPLDIEDALQVIQDYGLNVERTEVKDEVFPDPNDIVCLLRRQIPGPAVRLMAQSLRSERCFDSEYVQC
jgi:putative PIN family toxin of toxin-antitoxin system